MKMRAEATADKLPIYRDLERMHAPSEVTHLVYDDVSSQERQGTAIAEWRRMIE